MSFFRNPICSVPILINVMDRDLIGSLLASTLMKASASKLKVWLDFNSLVESRFELKCSNDLTDMNDGSNECTLNENLSHWIILPGLVILRSWTSLNSLAELLNPTFLLFVLYIFIDSIVFFPVTGLSKQVN